MSQTLLSNVLPVGENNTLERIRANALEHFSKYGYVGASVREITQAARVTKPTLYYYFDNKEDLFRHLAVSCFSKMMAMIEKSVNITGSFTARFCALVEAYYTFCDFDFPAARFVKVISVAPPRDVPDVGVELHDKKLSAFINNIVSDAVASKEIEEVRKPAVELLVQSLFSTVVEKRLKGDCISMQNIADALKCLLANRS